MNIFILDIEADALLLNAKKAWIIGWLDKATGLTRYWLNGDLGWKEELDKADVVVAHNGTGYDLPLLKKLFNYELPLNVEVRDTLIMSQVLCYNRFPNGRHRLADWGEFFNEPKGDFSDFSQFSEEMLVYWKQDLRITDSVHRLLMGEFNAIVDKPGRPDATPNKLLNYLRAENATNTWFAEAELHGWPFDVPKATALLIEMEASLQAVRETLLPKLGTKTVAVDKKLGVVEPKKPKWRKDGAYDAHTTKWFDIIEWSGQDEDRLVEGPYSRVEFVNLDVDSIADVKIFLFRNNWKPTEWNHKREPDPNKPGRFIVRKTSPKITEDSLECMAGGGKLYCDFLTTASRVGILKGWLKNVDSNGRLHGSGFTIGTPSFRARHSIIVNVPSGDAAWGKQMRSLFITRPGYTMIGADSSGNQARGLAHYLKSPEYVDLLLNGDIHTFNANALDSVLKEMGISWDSYLVEQGVTKDQPHTAEAVAGFLAKGLTVPTPHTLEENLAKKKRGIAKRILYAFLFGASGGKLWSYIFSVHNDAKGKRLKTGFTKAVPGFKTLLEKLERVYTRTRQSGDGYIPGIAGNKIFCNSPHKLLVYLLQAAEKATCSAALMLIVRGLQAAKIPYEPCIFYHDEVDFAVPDEYAEEAAVIAKQAFIDGPKLFGITIMSGEALKGKNWFECH